MSVHLTYRVRCSICQPWTFIDAPGASCVAEAREQAKERGWTQRETTDGSTARATGPERGSSMRDRPMTLAERKAIRVRDREARFGAVTIHMTMSVSHAHRLMQAERRAWARRFG